MSSAGIHLELCEVHCQHVTREGTVLFFVRTWEAQLQKQLIRCFKLSYISGMGRSCRLSLHT
jgi:hypothetical protein